MHPPPPTPDPFSGTFALPQSLRRPVRKSHPAVPIHTVTSPATPHRASPKLPPRPYARRVKPSYPAPSSTATVTGQSETHPPPLPRQHPVPEYGECREAKPHCRGYKGVPPLLEKHIEGRRSAVGGWVGGWDDNICHRTSTLSLRRACQPSAPRGRNPVRHSA